MADFTTYNSGVARQLLYRCNELIANRSRFSSKEDFALSVIQNIFCDPSLDLLLLVPQTSDISHADVVNRLNGLIGFESTVFMTIYTNNSLFNEFIDAFCRHCIRSTANSSEAMESIFMWLLIQYLQYLLPIDEQKLSQLKNSNWLSGPLSSMPTSTVTSPRRLLRPEVLAASSPLEHISLRSGSFRTLYPRLLQFVGNLLNHLASLSYWPSIAQFQVLKTVLNHFNEFILSETDDSEFASLKLLLLRKPVFTELLQNFLERLLKNWPLGESYCLLIEIWFILVSPRQLHSIYLSDEKCHFFKEASSFIFIDLIQVQIRRLLDSGCAQMLETPVLDFLKDYVFQNEPMLDLFDQRGLPTIEYLSAILGNLSRNSAEIHEKLKKDKTCRRSVWAWLFQWIFSMTYQPPVNMHELERQIYELHELINWLMSRGTRRLDTSNLTHNSNSTFGSEDERTAWNHSILRPEMPECSVDKWTKMLFLTPHGRLQVLNRQAKFDYSKYSKQISDTFPAIGFWDIAPLARFLHQLSIRWTNSWLVRYLRQHGRDSFISQMMAKALLNGPSPPRYVPVFARMVPKHEARLNLRIFANIPKLIYILFIGLFFFTFLFKMFI